MDILLCVVLVDPPWWALCQVAHARFPGVPLLVLEHKHGFSCVVSPGVCECLLERI